MSHTLYAGAARRVINPLLGTRKAGLRLFGDPVQAIESDLMATTLILSDGDMKLAIIALDLCVMHPSEAAELRAGVAQALGIPTANVMLNLSHNHSAPALPRFMPDTPEHMALKQRYQRDLSRWVVESAVEANAHAQPARIGAGWGDCIIAVYRREERDGRDVLGEVPDHPIDSSVGVIRIDDLDGKSIATVFRYSCHPVTVGPRSEIVSSDFVGPARDVIERNLGGLAMFLQGCGGNINPRYGIGYEVDCRDIKNRSGMALGGEALKVAATINTNRKPGARRPLGNVPNILFTPWEPISGDTCTYLGAAEKIVPLSFIALPSPAEAEAIHSHWQDALDQRIERDAQEWEIRYAEKFVLWSSILVNAVKQGNPTCDLHLQAFRINDIVIVGMDVETFYETGLSIRAQSPFKDTFVCGYTNGSMSYLPRAEDYPAGGWKLDASYAVPDLLFQSYLQPVAFHPDAEQRAVAGTLATIKQLAS